MAFDTPDTTGTLSPGSDFGPYRIHRLLGAGGMGEVYEATDTRSQRRVALKIMAESLGSAEHKARFMREGRLAASIRHPNSVFVFGADVIDERPAISMELVHGETLRDRVAREGPFPVTAAVDATLQILDGLTAAHDTGVLHRDVKPANCFLDADGTVKLFDYGLSVSTFATDASRMTVAGTLLGTPSFASPEQLRGEEASIPSDVYGVGATLYFLLTGVPPHEGSGPVGVIANALTRAPVPVAQLRPDVSRSLSRIVSRCLAISPADRYRTCAELRAALEPLAASAYGPARLGRRFFAGFVDLLLPTVITVLPGLRLYWSEDPGSFAAAIGPDLTVMLVTAAYLALSEGVFGTTVGKRLFSLRVLRTNGQPITPREALIRVSIFMVPDVLDIVLLGFYFGLTAAAPTGWIDMLMLIPFAVLFVTIRPQNGWAAIHDLVSDSRVVAPRATSSEAASVRSWRRRAGSGTHENTRPVRPDTPARFDRDFRWGPFAAVAPSRPAGPARHIARDSDLHRQVIIVEAPPGAPEVPFARRQLNVPTRARWLSGARTREQAWDAFELPEGKPFAEAVERGVEWPVLRSWLRSIAEDSRVAAPDPDTDHSVSLDQLWVTAAGDLIVLDWAAPGADGRGASRQITDPSELLAFLRDVVDRAMPADHPMRPRLPRHAADILERLEHDDFADADAIITAIDHTPAGVNELEWQRRLASLGFPLIWLVLTVGLVLMTRATEQRSWTNAYPDLVPPTVVRAMHRNASDDFPSLSQAAIDVLVEDYHPILSDSGFWSSPAGRAIDYRRGDIEELLRRPAGPQEDLDESRALVDEFAPRQMVRESMRLIHGSIVIWALAAFVFSLLAVLVSGHQPALRMFDIVVSARAGRPASRWRTLLRVLVGWGGFILIGYAAARAGVRWTDLSTPSMSVLDFMPLVVVVAIGALLVVWCVRDPERAPVDRICRTRLVIR